MTDRILFVSAVSDFKGGAEVVLRNMLGNPHVEPVLAVPELGPLAEMAAERGIPVCTYHPTAMLQVRRPPRLRPMVAAAADAWRCASRLRALARTHGCGVIHSNGLKAHMLCALPATGSGARTKTLVHLHDIAYRPAERLIWKAIAHRVDRMILVSRPCYPAGVLPAHVTVLPNGIVPVHETLPAGREPGPLERGPLRLGFVGRFHPNKGLDLLLDWFKAVRAGGPEATLVIRGRPDPDLPEYWTRIQDRIRDEALGGFVRIEGWTSGAATYAGLDVLLVTSLVPDPAPLVVPEAMSAGVVVAGYPAGGVPGMVADGRTGFLVRTGEELAGRLRALVADPARLEAMRAAAHAAVLAEFGMDRFHERLAEIYRSMLR